MEPTCDTTAIPTRVWTRVVLTALFIMAAIAIIIGFYLTVQDVHNSTCKAIDQNTKFIKDTDSYISRNSTHPDDPAIKSIHKFLLGEVPNAC